MMCGANCAHCRRYCHSKWGHTSCARGRCLEAGPRSSQPDRGQALARLNHVFGQVDPAPRLGRVGLQILHQPLADRAGGVVVLWGGQAGRAGRNRQQAGDGHGGQVAHLGLWLAGWLRWVGTRLGERWMSQPRALPRACLLSAASQSSQPLRLSRLAPSLDAPGNRPLSVPSQHVSRLEGFSPFSDAIRRGPGSLAGSSTHCMHHPPARAARSGHSPSCKGGIASVVCLHLTPCVCSSPRQRGCLLQAAPTYAVHPAGKPWRAAAARACFRGRALQKWCVPPPLPGAAEIAALAPSPTLLLLPKLQCACPSCDPGGGSQHGHKLKHLEVLRPNNGRRSPRARQAGRLPSPKLAMPVQACPTAAAKRVGRPKGDTDQYNLVQLVHCPGPGKIAAHGCGAVPPLRGTAAAVPLMGCRRPEQKPTVQQRAGFTWAYGVAGATKLCTPYQ